MKFCIFFHIFLRVFFRRLLVKFTDNFLIQLLVQGLGQLINNERMIIKKLGFALFPTMLFLIQFSYGQGIIKNVYYDKDSTTLWKTYQVSEKNSSIKQGFYKEYSPEGVLLMNCYYDEDVPKGKMLARKPNGYIFFRGYYDQSINFNGFQFDWKDTLHYTELIVNIGYGNKQNPISPEEQNNAIDSLKTRLDQIDQLKTLPVFSGYVTEANSKYLTRQSLPHESNDYLVSGNELIYTYITLLENYQEYIEDEKDINQFIRLADTLHKKYPGLYSEKLNMLVIECEKYDDPLPKIEVKYCACKKTESKIRGIHSKMVSLIDLDNQLAGLNTFVTSSYKPLKYPVLYTNKIQPLLQEANDRENQKDINTRLAKMAELVESLQVYKDKFPILNETDQKIESEWPALKENVKNKFQDSWSNHTKYINNLYDEYYAEENITRKINKGLQLINEIEELKNDFTEAYNIRNRIEEYYTFVDTHYSTDQPFIYEAQVKPLAEKVADYRKKEDFKSQISAGREIALLINGLYLNFDTLNSHEKIITTGYQNISKLYEKNYKGIYNKEVKNLSLDISYYQKISNYENKLNKGKQLLPILKSYETKYQLIESHKKNITDSLKIASSLYKKAIPPVYKDEIRQIKAKKQEYNKIETLDLKITKGYDILRNLSKLISNFDNLRLTNNQLKESYSFLEKNYRKRYKKIYKASIVPMGKDLQKYRGLGKLDERLQTGKTLLQQVEVSKTQLTDLDTTAVKMETNFTQFQSTYKNDKPNRIYLKRGKILNDYYKNQFFRSDNYDKSMKSAGHLNSLLAKLRSFSTKGNPIIKESLRKAKKVEDIEKAIN